MEVDCDIKDCPNWYISNLTQFLSTKTEFFISIQQKDELGMAK